MGDARLERVTNLVTFLLHTREPVSLREIVEQVPGYPPGDAARRQAFERDKRILRDEGIPLTEHEGRYRIRPEDYYLPDLQLTREERVALNVAVAAVRVGPAAGRAGLLKLGGLEEPGVLDATPAVRAELSDLPVLPALHTAARTRSVVRFAYRGEEREVEPQGLLFRQGHWYLVGHDRTRAARRSFRVDRIEGGVATGPAGGFAAASPIEADTVLAREPWRFGEEEPVTAVVALDAVLAGRLADQLPGAELAPGADGGAEMRITVTNREAFRSWVVGLADHAEVLAPEDLRAEVVGWLETIAALR